MHDIEDHHEKLQYMLTILIALVRLITKNNSKKISFSVKEFRGVLGYR